MFSNKQMPSESKDSMCFNPSSDKIFQSEKVSLKNTIDKTKLYFFHITSLDVHNYSTASSMEICTLKMSLGLGYFLKLKVIYVLDSWLMSVA